MKNRLVITRDGSHTLYRPDLDEQYHSKYGALQESLHIYIHSGLRQIPGRTVRIFEVGFGTGLNAVLSLIEVEKTNQSLYYDSIEKYPLDMKLIKRLNYIEYFPEKYHHIFYEMHAQEWNESKQTGNMTFRKISGDIKTHVFDSLYDLIYFDAFGPEKEPDLWSSDIFKKIYQALENGGILITFSVKGEIRRRLQEFGFHTEKIPGPPGKKHILRAVK